MSSMMMLAAVGLIVSASSPASAGVLQLEDSTLEISLLRQLGIPPTSFDQSPASIPIFVLGDGSFSEPAFIFSGSQTMGCAGNPQACPGTGPFAGVDLIDGLNVFAANSTKIVSPSGGPNGGFGGPGALSGTAQIIVLGGLVNLPVPLSPVGIGGTAVGGAATLMITVTGAQWTTGTAVVAALPSATPSDATFSSPFTIGSDNRTPTNHAGTITLVTAARVKTNAAGNIPLFAVQKLKFVPEPSGFVMLGAGAMVLGLLGRRRH